VGRPVTEVTVQTFPNWLEASVWAERLRSEGIPVVLHAVGPGVGRFGTDQLWPHELRVRSTDLQRAREILSAPDEAP
jgi:Putative prokaryotic signal transducing protein